MTPAGGPLLVVPSAQDEPTGRRLVAVASALADQADGTRALVWQTGPLVGELAAITPTTDAAAVNAWAPARLLGRARLGPLARLAKNRRLRALLAPLADASAVLVGDPSALDALAWLPGGDRRTAVLVPPGSRGRLGERWREGLGCADVVVALDPATRDWLADDVGIAADALSCHALLPGEPPADEPRALGLVGWSASDVSGLLAGVGAPDEVPPVSWFAPEEVAWSLWQGPTASPFAIRLTAVPGDPTLDSVGALRLLVATGDDPLTLWVIAAAQACGVPVVHHHGPEVEAAAAEARSTLAAGPAPTATADTLTVTAGVEALVTDLAASG